jgi:hypothetical protein
MVARVFGAGVQCLVEKRLLGHQRRGGARADCARERRDPQVGTSSIQCGVQKMKEIVKTPRLFECHARPYDPRCQGHRVVLDLMIHDIDIILRLVNSP